MCEEVLGPKDPRWAVISPIRGACFEVSSLSVYTVDKRGIVDNVNDLFILDGSLWYKRGDGSV